ncbi:MAG: class I SAM-dependent methyltransferase [Sulfurimonas sp.]|nr:class I SAM-dependent methyltransferase [Sulfurimonas sp.]
MTNLDLYAKAEHLLGIEEATEALYDLYRSELDGKNVKTLLDVGCGRGGFMQRMISDGVVCKGVDLSSVMVQECLDIGLDVECINASDVTGKYDAIVSIFDVLNFMDSDTLVTFLNSMADKLNDDGILIADINTLYGFKDVAEGSMSKDRDDEFLSVDAIFQNDKLDTQFTLFEKRQDGSYVKHQDSIIQHFHKIKTFQKLEKLKLVEKQTFSLYDTEDKTLLIFKKK